MRALLAAAAIAAAPPSAHAADDAGSFAADGAGRASCAFLTRAVSAEGAEGERARLEFGAWLSGFMDAANAFSPRTFDLTPWQTPEIVLAKIGVYCRSNPEAAVVMAAMRLVEALLPGRLEAAQPRVQARAGDRAVALYPQTVTRLRSALAAAGHDLSPEGGYDEEMAAALRAAQAGAGLPVTGLPDAPTLILLLDGAAQGTSSEASP